jgi:hypothetical protein
MVVTSAKALTNNSATAVTDIALEAI